MSVEPASETLTPATPHAPALIAGALVMLYPLMWMVSSSLKPKELIFTDLSLWPRKVWLENYADGWAGIGVSFGRSSSIRSSCRYWRWWAISSHARWPPMPSLVWTSSSSASGSR